GLHSIIEVNPEALDIAEALVKERKDTGARGPLHGIPVLLKDNVGTSDRMTTTAGSLELEGSIPQKDSFVAERLRAAGGVLLAEANFETLTFSIEIPGARAPARAPRPRRTSARSQSAPRPTARSFVPRTR